MQQSPIITPFLNGLPLASLSSMSTYTSQPGMYEYLLVANPDKETGSQVMAEKQLFYEHYEQRVAVKTQPHITVANFLAQEGMEDTIGRWLQRICSQQQSFKVMLNNFSGFPPHTVYVRIQNPQPFQLLARQFKVIDGYIRSNGCPPAKLISNPHITIARRLPEMVYTKAMNEYARREFHAAFIVNELVLLKRKSQFDTCEKINVFRLLPDVAPVSYSDQLKIF